MRSERHWSIYLPALLISFLWAGVLFWSDRHEPPLVTLRFFALVVEAIIVPALFAWAFFRGRRSEVRLSGESLFVSTGGRRPEKIGADLRFVENVRVAQSALQKLVGAGRVEIHLAGGRRLVLDDMSKPHAISAAIEQARGREKSDQKA